MKAKHTNDAYNMMLAFAPAPWEIFRSNQHPRKPIVIGHKYGVVCNLNQSMPKQEIEALAHLIAASPLLLDELETLCRVLRANLEQFSEESTDEQDSQEEILSVIYEAEEVIAKAKGE